MIAVSKARQIVLGRVGVLGTETVELGDCTGRVLAEDIVSDSDLPPFDRSQMDGFAARAADTIGAPVLLKIVGESAAGSGWHKRLKEDEAVRIMTGAPVPKGADAVQKVELTLETGGTPGIAGETVTILEATTKGKYIVPKGYEIKKGEVVFRKGEIVTPEKIAVLASFGYKTVSVAKRPKVAILSTGSEIVDVGEKPGKDQIRNSNSPMLRALAERFGCAAELLPIAKDDVDHLRASIAKAAASVDIVVITGGVSVGKYDLTKTALADAGAEIFFDKIRLKPGKPMVFGQLGGTLIFGLPGNPVSVAVTFHLFVRAAVLKMQGATDAEMPSGFAMASRPIKGTKERDSYLPVRLKSQKSGILRAEPLRWHGSSDFIGFSRADALAVVPRGTDHEKGDVVKILFLRA